jgi:hypothetical protein
MDYDVRAIPGLTDDAPPRVVRVGDPIRCGRRVAVFLDGRDVSAAAFEADADAGTVGLFVRHRITGERRQTTLRGNVEIRWA